MNKQKIQKLYVCLQINDHTRIKNNGKKKQYYFIKKCIHIVLIYIIYCIRGNI